ncbi:MAG: SagB/ThcOx family dehydrogenase [Magnetococcus sp. DMHC-1]|nr:SagB/ThcOx family dehydrogenase [Magnetococcales bacterium]
MQEPLPGATGIRAYHIRSKHFPRHYAAGPGYVDWETQPDPFRRHAGSPVVPLPLLADALQTPFADVYRPAQVNPLPFDAAHVALLFELSLGLAAWKEYQGIRWALRCNPSSGNLHPTEGYAILPTLAATWPESPFTRQATGPLTAGIYHYSSRDHILEARLHLAELSDLLPKNTFLIGLSSIHWREAWKYGERSYRYCQLDVGHAVGALRYAAAALGWRVTVLLDPSDADVTGLLGLNQNALSGAEAEYPDLLLLVQTDAGVQTHMPRERLATMLKHCQPVDWLGRPNVLSQTHAHEWPAIDEAVAATIKPVTSEGLWHPEPLPDLRSSPDLQVLPATHPAATLIRHRRSGQTYDPRATLSRDAFFHMLDRLLPRNHTPPWDALPWHPGIHPVFFVHRVVGLEPGTYILVRHAESQPRLEAAMASEFGWEKPPGCPDHLSLFMLTECDMQEQAKEVSCHQEIAADGIFSLGMLADFAANLREGAWHYRRIFWEAGVLGHLLYLEAELLGLRGTGIGCFFDDHFHDFLGLEGDQFQSLYHFTVGKAIEDDRLVTLPAYSFQKDAQESFTGEARESFA